jgi:DNA helicase-2/ATP-dependent DNA helicase PcrA
MAAPQGRNPVSNVEISFSDLKYFIDCSYEFKLRLLYGFNPPINERLGFGRSLHNALADLHQRAIRGERFGPGDAASFVDTHLNVRYAHEALAADLRLAAIRSFERYIRDHQSDLDKLLHSEESVELHLPEGIVVNGRIDLVRRTDTDETAIVDFKSTERAQDNDVTRVQLHLYALGYEERFGKNADLIEIHPLDGTSATREQVSSKMIDETLDIVRDAGDRLRTNRFDHLPTGHTRCDTCDVRYLCRPKPTR